MGGTSAPTSIARTRPSSTAPCSRMASITPPRLSTFAARTATNAASQLAGCVTDESCPAARNTTMASTVSAAYSATLNTTLRPARRRSTVIATALPTSRPTSNAPGVAKNSPTTSGTSIIEME